MDSNNPKTKPKEKRQAPSKPSGHERLKTIVRRLPPNLPEDIFWQSVQNWVTDDTASWKIFYPGKLRKKYVNYQTLNKENVPSRAYIAFKNEELLADFSREYDGHIFRDKSGNEFQVVVEFAPYQKVPSEKKKADSRTGTIEKDRGITDEDYISFMKLLETESAKPHDTEQLLETLIASTQPAPMPKSTPLLEAIKAEKSAQKDKEAILRNHPHYKDVASSSASSKKDESKKKGGAPTSVKPVETQSASSKKGSKKAAAAAQKQTALSSTSQLKNGGASIATAAASITKAAQPPSTKSNKGERQQSQTQSQEPQLLKRPVTPASTTSIPVPPTPTSAPTETLPSGSAGAGGRRSRPVLGLASRQFEAALSGAGVSKTKRERAADREKDKDKGKESRGAAVAGEDGGKGKERERRHEDKTVGKAARQAKAEAGASAVIVPAILQRDGQQQQVAPKILTRSAEAEGSAVTPTSVTETMRGRGHAKSRGRGRGRGKEATRGG
ncbi:hypothetical protein EW146_g2181 [Bondarzewia mesenterica]|uniref:UPF3 domain-containing protein n=1 Tax=Bondarzewia mesenterica TaxID=1095465 RepID=A0A4S4M1P2_9AGAM|nr:hypothetical protein EW146_g2181 [Bondarzewia mesenterica]